MGFLNLILKIGYDGSQAEAGLRSLDQRVVEHSRRTQERLKANLLKGFVVGGTGAILTKFFGDARQQAELASANDITISQLSMIQTLAAQAGKSFEQYRSEIEKTGKSVAMFSAQHKTGVLQELEQAGAEGLNKAGGLASHVWKAIKLLSIPGMMGIFRLNAEDIGADKTSPAFKEAKSAIERLQKLHESEAATVKKMEQRRAADFPDVVGANGQYMDVMYERSRTRLEPRVNQLQQVGLMGVSQTSMIEIEREQITVLQHIDGTLEKIRENQALDPNKVDFGR